MAREVYVKLETITPDRAHNLLALNKRNRKLRPSRVKMLANTIRRGDWKLNGETIKLNGDELVDGQHRLQAVVESGKPIETFVAYGVGSPSFDTIDTGIPRGIADAFHRRSESYASVLGGAVRAAIAFQKGALAHKGYLENQIATRWLNANGEIRDSIHPCIATRADLVVPGSIVVALHYLYKKVGWPADKLDKFMELLGSGEHLDRTSPVYQLRKKMLASKIGTNRGAAYTREAVAALTMRAINNYLTTGKSEKLSIGRGGEGITMPEFAKPKGN